MMTRKIVKVKNIEMRIKIIVIEEKKEMEKKILIKIYLQIKKRKTII